MQHAATSTLSLRDHWGWRPDWATDRPRLLWYFTFDSHPDLARAAQSAADRLLGVPTVDVVPVPWLHMTLDDVGFVDELAPGQVDRVLETARATVSGWRSGPITLGPLVPMADALVLAADRVEEIEDLRCRLRAATTAVLGPEAPSVLDRHLPHVTLAYLNSACEAAAVMAPLEPVEQQVVVAAPRLTLASVTRRDRHYQWTTRAEVDVSVDTALSRVGPGTGHGPRRHG